MYYDLKIINLICMKHIMNLKLNNVKCIEFYKNHPYIDFEQVNVIFVDLMESILSKKDECCTHMEENEIKRSLHELRTMFHDMSNRVKDHGEILRLTSENICLSKQNHVDEIHRAFLQYGNNEEKIISSVKEINTIFLDKLIYKFSAEFPKINETMVTHMKHQQNDILRETDKIIVEAMRNAQSNDDIRNIIRKNYEDIYTCLNKSFQDMKNNEGKIVDVHNDLKLFLEKQKNSTLKGKESEEKLESCLVRAFPYSEIMNQSGKPQSCDYLIRRDGKDDIMIENKDYANNVPNEELRKFVRDVEYQNKHGILLSQNSGVSQKNDYQIDFHGKNIMIYLHFVKYDEHKIQSAVQIIDIVSKLVSQHVEDESNFSISIEKMQEINKEYLSFIQCKKTLIESLKKSCKEHVKMVEDFQMCRLTEVLNSIFTNIDTLTHKCELCGKIFKNNKGLVAHKRSCVTKQQVKHKNNTLDTNVKNDVVDLSKYENHKNAEVSDS